MTIKSMTELSVQQGLAPSDSPCVGICAPATGPQGQFCRGCYRTYEEIAGWRDYSPEMRLEVLYKIHFRRLVS